ncbi:coiled-coil domain-containing protein 136 isoform X1 [Anopheles moucheti]|uniref:coiled-coil domain-containing protein 136 isoform X1 n=1 Tax=Anopheles moucheti TaxID=186751 RepID=UPI0022F07B57|nr:coiled-coil domain-containing protein 136 isoform X1 [Anopheles moucheti]
MSAQLNGIGRWSANKAKRHQQPAQPCGDSEESSLDEFLEHELLCWLNEDKPIGEEIATIRPELYGELNHLFGVANDADNRCVEDILAEAERLMLQDPHGTDVEPAVQSPMGWGELLLPEMDPSPNRDALYLQTVSPDCVKVLDVDCRGTYNETVDSRPQSQTMDTSKPSNLIVPTMDESCVTANKAVAKCTPTPACTPRQRRQLDQPAPINALEETQLEPPHNQCGRNRTVKQTANCNSSSPALADRRQVMCDRSTQPSPTPEDDEPNDQYASWSKERLLEGKITELQERLKDTEERYHSLKLQYDTLSQVHRTLRENYGAMQEESEKLQFDIQHLTKCADVLRSELQSARCDRDSAIELQKILQSELDESRKEKKRLQDSGEKDTKTIQDLQRQCREMERILMRKNPDSISALIVASKSPTGKSETDGSTSTTCRLLEQRIAQLEADAKKQDAKAQGILADVQARFNSVQAKYETHIADLEMQVLSLQEINSKLNEKIIRQMEELASISSHAAGATVGGLPVAKATSAARFTQTESAEEAPECRGRRREPASVKVRSILVQTDVTGTVDAIVTRQPNAKRAQAQSKEDAHLLATIRGMRVDLAIKEKAVQRLTREVDECKKTIKKLQKKKEPPVLGRCDSGRSPVKVRNKVADSCADSPDSGGPLRDAQSKVKILELDYKALQEKRLQDLKTLQAAHEKELASCHESIRFLQQRLAESEEELLQRKDKQRPNHSNDYYGLKAKRKRTLKRVTPRHGQILARKCWLSAGHSRHCKALVQHMLKDEFHCTKTNMLLRQQTGADNKLQL